VRENENIAKFSKAANKSIPIKKNNEMKIVSDYFLRCFAGRMSIPRHSAA
jgi:hypothetical protein